MKKQKNNINLVLKGSAMSFSPRQLFAVILSAVVLVVLLLSLGSLLENLDAGKVMVIQSPVSGELVWHTTPGVKWQGFGKVTKYQKREQFWFSSKEDQGEESDESIKIRFNDGGHATISGGISWEIPLAEEQLTLIHTKFGSQLAVEQQLVRTMVEKSIYMTGPIMSSKESYAERRNELLHLIEDQISNGVCLTKTTQENTTDPITGIEKTVAKVELVTDVKTGELKRAEESPLKEFGVKVFNLAINAITYDPLVEGQIAQQQKAMMQVQIAIAEAKTAEQEALTTKKEGEAKAAKAEWEQKAIAAKQEQEAKMKKNIAETLAEQKVAVAELELKAAESMKKAEIAKGEGEAKRRTLVMEADGALEKKLEAYVDVNKAYAEAIAKHQGAWVPSVVMGANAQNQATGGGAIDLINLLTVKAAKDLSLEMSQIGQKVVKPAGTEVPATETPATETSPVAPETPASPEAETTN